MSDKDKKSEVYQTGWAEPFVDNLLNNFIAMGFKLDIQEFKNSFLPILNYFWKYLGFAGNKALVYDKEMIRFIVFMTLTLPFEEGLSIF